MERRSSGMGRQARLGAPENLRHVMVWGIENGKIADVGKDMEGFVEVMVQYKTFFRIDSPSF
jgi:hypothetical protein